MLILKNGYYILIILFFNIGGVLIASKKIYFKEPNIFDLLIGNDNLLYLNLNNFGIDLIVNYEIFLNKLINQNIFIEINRKNISAINYISVCNEKNDSFNDLLFVSALKDSKIFFI